MVMMTEEKTVVMVVAPVLESCHLPTIGHKGSEVLWFRLRRYLFMVNWRTCKGIQYLASSTFGQRCWA